MRSALAAIGFVVLSVSLYAQQQGQFLVVLTDAEGRPPATAISPAEFAVQEGGQPTKVLKVEPSAFPTRVTLAIENSRGLGDAIANIRNGAKAFVNALPDDMEIMLVSTAPQPRIVVKSTKKKDDVTKAIDRLAPESSSGRYIEALTEQIDRWDKDKERGLYTPILVIMGSTLGEELVRDNWIPDALAKLSNIAGVTIHSLMYEAPLTATGGGGDLQMQVARTVSERTRGRFEAFAASQRIGTLLPEIAAQIAKQQSGGQYLITIERPAGATGRLGPLSMSPPSGVKVGKITRVEVRK